MGIVQSMQVAGVPLKRNQQRAMKVLLDSKHKRVSHLFERMPGHGTEEGMGSRSQMLRPGCVQAACKKLHHSSSIDPSHTTARPVQPCDVHGMPTHVDRP